MFFDAVFPIIIAVIVLAVLILLIAYLVRIVPQANAYVIERLGAYHSTWGTGIHILIPFIDRVANRVTLKEVVKDFAPQPVITKDNVTMQIDTVVYFQITDPKMYTYGVVGPVTAIENLTATTLRNIIGELELGRQLLQLPGGGLLPGSDRRQYAPAFRCGAHHRLHRPAPAKRFHP